MTFIARLIFGLTMLIASAVSANAHALEPGFLDVKQLTPDTWQVFWLKPDVQGAPMEIDARLPQNCTPGLGPTPMFDGAAWVSGWVANCSPDLVGEEIVIDGLTAQRTDVLLRLQPLDQATTTVRLTAEIPSHIVEAEPSTSEVFFSYLWLGFEHILEGWDHLLFVFALIVLIRNPWRLVAAITAFTIAHSITLALAALGHVSLPGPPVEACIALSIVFLAIEIVKHQEGQLRLSERFPWVISFSFGLLHGLGFAGALSDIGLPQGEVPAALLAFNVGVEAGQLFFVGIVLSIIWLASRAIPASVRSLRNSPTLPTNIAGYAIGGMATFWLAQRIAGF